MAKAVSSYPFKPSGGEAPAEPHDPELPNPAALSTLGSLSLVNRTALYKASFERGVEWLLDHSRPDGSIGEDDGTVFYYRVGWSLALAGRIPEAQAHIAWAAEHGLPGYGVEAGSLSGGPAEDEQTDSYALTCIAMGASLLHRDDIAAECGRLITRFQHPQSGGFVNNLGGSDFSQEEVLMSTAQGGMSLLQLGRLEDAVRVGEWHQKLWAAQPDIGSALYHTWSPTADGLRTELREGEEQSELYCIKDDVWQWHFDGSIAAAFLGKLCVPPKPTRARRMVPGT